MRRCRLAAGRNRRLGDGVRGEIGRIGIASMLPALGIAPAAPARAEWLEARVLLRPLAHDPHAPADHPAARMLAAREAGRSGAEAIAVGERQPAPTPNTVP